VNCGLPAISRESWRQVARQTAAHSTVTFNDTSSSRFLASNSLRRLLGTPILAGPTDVPVLRQESNEALTLGVSHDGYADRFGVVHQRLLRLAVDGRRLDGEDAFAPAKGEELPSDRADEFAVRFHLHPSVRPKRLDDGHGVMLMMPNKEIWGFSAYDDDVEVEESVYLAGSDGPRRTAQIVVYGRARNVPRVRWTFAHVDPLAPPPQASAGEESQPSA
jgi:uncharacterized heparinase superfamily protein